MLRAATFGSVVLTLLTTAACGDDEPSSAGGGGSGGSSSTTASTSTTTTTSTTTSTTTTTTTSSTGEGGDGGGDGGGGGEGGEGAGGDAGLLVGSTLAVSAWFLGDTTRDGMSSIDAWQDYGVDLDGLETVDVDDDGQVTLADLDGHCRPVQSAANARNLEDGPGGIDNSFGRNLLPFTTALVEAPSEVATYFFENGDSAFILHLDEDQPTSDGDPLPARLFHGVEGFGPTWALDPDYLAGGDPGTPVNDLPLGSVAGDLWLSVEPATIRVPLPIMGLIVHATVHRATIAVQLDAAHTSGTEGLLVGVLDTEELVVAMAEAFSAHPDSEGNGLCPGDALFESVVQTFRNASDMLIEGDDAEDTCDGISIAIGFDATAIDVDRLADPSEPEPLCP